MSQPLTDAINALTTYANEITGQSDTTLSDAVESLVDGYGGGGGITWDGLINNEYSTAEVVYSGTTLPSPIPILKCNIKSLTLSEVTKKLGISWGDGGCWEELYAPKLTSLGLYGLRNCKRMKKVYLPKVTNLDNNNGLNGCSELTGIVLPSYNDKIGSMSFKGNTKLVYGDFKKVTNIETSAFESATLFVALIIRNTDSIATLANINAFSNTPFASGKTGGTLYVPSALISSYQAATNWNTILGYSTNTITAIEGSVYETQYADGTPISTT